jgi:hypothetical protein
MKKPLLSLFIAVMWLAGWNSVQAQCTFLNTNYPAGTFTPTTSFQTASTLIYAGEYSAYNVVLGTTYQWSLCSADGGNATYDSELTLWRSTNTATPLAYADQECGDDAILTWTATFSGVVYVQVNEYSCLTNSLSTTLVYRSFPVSLGCAFNNNQFPTTIFTPTSNVFQQASTNIYAGEYSAYNVTAGNTYEWSLCAADGGSATYNSQLSLYNSANTSTAIVFSDDACGDDAKITWTASFTGTVYVQVNQFPCTTNSTSTTLVYRRSAAAGVPPVNDNCATATVLQVNSFCSATSGTTQNATASTPTTSCTGTAEDDVWYRFTSVNTQDLYVEVIPNGTGFDPVFELFSGTTCGNMVSLGCIDAGGDGVAEAATGAMTGVPVGTVYWLRIFDYYSTANNNPNFTVCVYQSGFANTPGDDCDNAIPVGVTTTCTNPVFGDLGSFTASASTGNDCVNGYVSDVWYSFTAQSDSVFYDLAPYGATMNPVVEIYEGADCAALAFVGCADFELAGFTESVSIAPTVAGTTYYVRIMDANLNAATNLGYDFCAYDTFIPQSQAPANDNCSGAYAIQAGTFCNPYTATFANATASTPTTTCGGTNGEDVWFQVFASDTAFTFEATPFGTGEDLVAEFFLSATNSCSNLTSFGCLDGTANGAAEAINVIGLSPGDVVWIRVYDYNAGVSANPNFNVCAYWENLAPSNDNCAGATVIQAGPTCVPFTGTMAGASASTPTTACGGTNEEDVWYQIFASDTAITVEITPLGTGEDLVGEFFVSSTGDCNGLVSIGCLDATAAGGLEAVNVIGLAPGDAIWVRVYDYNAGTPANPGFTICGYWTPQTPSNDECAGATLLTASTTCNPTSFTAGGATASAPTSSCSVGGLPESDVWFRFVATSTSATIRVGSVNGSDPVIQYFSGSCANLVSRGCSDFFIEGVDENLTATGLVAGQTYYVRVYDYRGAASPSQEFNICIISNTSSPNDNCNTAIPLTTSDPATYAYFNTALATQSSAGCSGNANDDVWFSFVAAQNTTGTTISVGGDLDFSSVYQVYSGTCASLTPVQCVNNVTTGTYDIETNTFNTLTPGQTYYVRVYDFDASVTNSTFYVHVLGTPVGCNLADPVASANGSTTLCGSGSVSLSTGFVAGLSYQWRRNGITIPGATTTSYSATQSGDYTVVITDANSCTAESNSITVTITPQPSGDISASGSTTVCTGGSVSLSTPVQTGITYQWYRNGIIINGATSATYSAAQTGTYTVQFTAAPGCSSTSNGIDVNVITAPTANITASGSTTICQGSSSILTVTTQVGVSIQWQLNTINIPGATSSTYTATQAGTYRAVVSAGAGCSANSNTITLTVVAGPTASITSSGNTQVCAGTPVSLTAGTVAGATYQWQNSGVAIPGATSTSYNAVASGSYTVLVSTAACAATSNAIDVVVNPIPSATITAGGPTTFCTGSSVTLNAPETAGAIYQWNNAGTPILGASGSTYTTSQAGTYTVTVSANGCSATSANTVVTVTPAPNATITATGSTTVCQGNSVTLNANTGAGLSYQWLLNGSPIPSATGVSYTANVAGNYTVTVSQGANCSATSNAANVNILALPQVSVAASGPLAICQGSSVNLSASPTAGNTFQWQIGGANISGATNATYAANAAGSYAVVVTSTNGCSATSTPSVVTVNSLPNASITPNGPTTFCVGGNVLLQANSGNGLSYQWNNGGSPINGAVNTVLNVSQTGSYTVTVTDLNTCTATSNPLAVNVAGVAASITLDGPAAICDGASIQLHANTDAGLTYVWNQGGSVIAGATASSYTVTAGGNYSVTVTDMNNCSSTSDVITVNVGQTPAQPLVTPLSSTTVCEGEDVTLNTDVALGIEFQWLQNGVEIPGENLPVLITGESGVYSVVASNASGCENESEPVSVTVNPLPVVSLVLPVNTACLKESLTLSGGAPANGVYEGFDVSNGIFTPLEVGVYDILYTVTDNNGCSNFATAEITVEDCAGIENLRSDAVSLYPNPANEMLFLEFSRPESVQSVQVIDLSGRVVSVNVVKGADQRYRLHTAELASGVYQVVILTDEGRAVKNFVKTH